MKSPFGMIAAALMLLAAPAMAADIKFPELTGPVVDTVDEIPAEQEARIDAKIRAFRDETGHQIQVLTVPDTQDLTISEYGNRLIREWGIGRAGADDGIILIHALKSEGGRIRIETGYGVEGYMTDAMSSVILNGTIVPAFKAKQFGDGIEQGVDRIMEEARITPEQRREDEAREASEAARRSQAAWDGFMTFLGWVMTIAATAGASFGAWFMATAGRRRRRREAEALQRIADAEAAAAAEKVRARVRAEEERRRREALERLAAERAAMLAAMEPRERERFLADERAAAEAARIERERLKAIRDQEEKERRARQKKRDEEEERTRRSSAGSSSSGSTFGGSSGGSDGGSNWSGGGGSGGGGGASADY